MSLLIFGTTSCSQILNFPERGIYHALVTDLSDSQIRWHTITSSNGTIHSLFNSIKYSNLQFSNIEVPYNRTKKYPSRLLSSWKKENDSFSRTVSFIVVQQQHVTILFLPLSVTNKCLCWSPLFFITTCWIAKEKEGVLQYKINRNKNEKKSRKEVDTPVWLLFTGVFLTNSSPQYSHGKPWTKQNNQQLANLVVQFRVNW